MCAETSKRPWGTDRDGYIKFSFAHKCNLHQGLWMCPDCVEKYYLVVSKMNPPIIIK